MVIVVIVTERVHKIMTVKIVRVLENMIMGKVK